MTKNLSEKALKEWSDSIGCAQCDPELQQCRECEHNPIINFEEEEEDNDEDENEETVTSY